MSRKGFTLIELLAVITILGILMLVAIPNITRTIENSRKDTFANLAQTYINTLKTAIASNDVVCCIGHQCASDSEATWVPISTISQGMFFFNFDTAEGIAVLHPWHQQTIDLMGTGGKSPWGNAAVTAKIRIERYEGRNDKYTIWMRDTANHGIVEAVDQSIDRSSVGELNQLYFYTGSSSVYACKLG